MDCFARNDDLSYLCALRFLADFLAVFFAVFFFAAALFGTFFPSARASERPIAIACLRLVPFLPDRPLFNVPALRFFITRSTSAEAFLEYFRAMMVLPVAGKQSWRMAMVPVGPGSSPAGLWISDSIFKQRHSLRPRLRVPA